MKSKVAIATTMQNLAIFAIFAVTVVVLVNLLLGANSRKKEMEPVATATMSSALIGGSTPSPQTAIARCGYTLAFVELRSYLKSIEDESRRQSVIDGQRGCQIGGWEGWVDDFTNGGTRVKIDMDPPSIGSIHDVEFDVPAGLVGKLQKNQRIVFSGVIDYGSSERRLGVTSLRIYLIGATVSPK